MKATAQAMTRGAQCMCAIYQEKVIEELAEIAEPSVFFADDESLIDADRDYATAGITLSS